MGSSISFGKSSLPCLSPSPHPTAPLSPSIRAFIPVFLLSVAIVSEAVNDTAVVRI